MYIRSNLFWSHNGCSSSTVRSNIRRSLNYLTQHRWIAQDFTRDRVNLPCYKFELIYSCVHKLHKYLLASLLTRLFPPLILKHVYCLLTDLMEPFYNLTLLYNVYNVNSACELFQTIAIGNVSAEFVENPSINLTTYFYRK